MDDVDGETTKCEQCGEETPAQELWAVDDGAILVCNKCRFTVYPLSTATRLQVNWVQQPGSPTVTYSGPMGRLSPRQAIRGSFVDDLRERLAALAHDQWISWATDTAATEPITHAGIQRWNRLIMTSYAELTEAEKDQDRAWADKVLACVKGDEDGDEGMTTLWQDDRGWTRLIEQRFDPDAVGLSEDVQYTVLERHTDWYGNDYWLKANLPLVAAQLINWLIKERAKA